MSAAVRLVVGLALLAAVAALALVVAATGGSTGVRLVWPEIGLDRRPTVLGVFLLGAAAVLAAEGAVRLVVRSLPLTGRRRGAGAGRRCATRPGRRSATR